MKRYRDIIESPFPVPVNALWLNGNKLKGFINGKWTTIGGTNDISWDDISDKPVFSTVATSGSYNDLKNKPNIPQAYTLPAASSSALGGVKSSTTGTTSGKDYLVQVNSDGTMKVNVPWTDTTYQAVTGKANGLMTVALLQKLNGIEANANNYQLPAAGTSIGGVKKATSVANIADTSSATSEVIAQKLNELLAAMRTAGQLSE